MHDRGLHIATAVHLLERRILWSVDLTFGGNPSLDSDYVGDLIPLKGTFSVRNVGDTATSGGVTYRAVLTHESDLSGTLVVVGTGTIPALSPFTNDDALVEFEFAVPAGQVGQTFFFAIVLDPNNTIAETDETNNKAIDGTFLGFPETLSGNTLTGTTGNDRIVVQQIKDALIIHHADADPNKIFMAPASGASLTVNLLEGDDVLDAIQGVQRSMSVNAGDGNDFIFAGDGDDTIAGGSGSDTLYGNEGSDVIKGNAGRDTLFGGNGNDYLAGNGQSDRLSGQNGDDILFGNGGRDILHGQAGDDRLIGGAGNDVLSDNEFPDDDDNLIGNAGNDVGYANVSDLLSSIEQQG